MHFPKNSKFHHLQVCLSVCLSVCTDKIISSSDDEQFTSVIIIITTTVLLDRNVLIMNPIQRIAKSVSVLVQSVSY